MTPDPTAGNRLSLEKSPYLLQHASNPVDWHPWSPEAFERARTEDKPVFLSIGYATCHWCHVMERESFEDPETARLLNRTFVCVKVDREERPDIDAVYMRVCQMLTGSGGWPLTIFMTPDRRPFFAATYLPRHTRFGRTGLAELCAQVERLWQSDRQKILNSAAEIAAGLVKGFEFAPGAPPDDALLARAAAQIAADFDPRWGGFGQAPKFPTPHRLLFLLAMARAGKAPEGLA
ncbi:MAG: thioredoxin domain-containing protein, partial [Desulfobacteraceae bacterium]